MIASNQQKTPTERLNDLGTRLALLDRAAGVAMTTGRVQFGAAWDIAVEALVEARGLVEQYQALQLAATRQLTPLDVAATHIEIIRSKGDDYTASERDNVAAIVESHVKEARAALFAAVSIPASERGEDPGEDARVPDDPITVAEARRVMEEHGYAIPDWKPTIPRGEQNQDRGQP